MRAAGSTLPDVQLGRLARLRVRAARSRAKLVTLVKRSAPAFRPAKAPLKNLVSMPLTTAAAFCFSIASFQVSFPVGMACTGVLLIALEHLIADE